MKVSTQVPESAKGKKFVPPPIPFSRPVTPELKKHECLVMKLRSDPANPDSQIYDLTVKYFRTGPPEEWLLFQRDLRRILNGQNITTGPAKYVMIRRLVMGDTLAVFDNAAQTHGNETNANFELCLRDVSTHIFPQRALAHQKRYMRRYMRKPREVAMREFAARVAEMNEYLSQFPPFDNDQSLTNEEIVDILEFAVPNSWQKSMVLQGFDPLIHTVSEFVSFCERHEFTEGTLDNSKEKGAKPKTISKSGSNGAKWRAKSSVEAKTKSKTTEKFCDLHQQFGHSTSECKVVQGQIQRMRSSWESIHPSQKGKRTFTSFNKQNNQKEFAGNNSKKTANKESVMTLVKESMKELFKNKKRKVESTFNVDEFDDFDASEFKDLQLSDSESSENEK
jgi:hypothetical protein